MPRILCWQGTIYVDGRQHLSQTTTPRKFLGDTMVRQKLPAQKIEVQYTSWLSVITLRSRASNDARPYIQQNPLDPLPVKVVSCGNCISACITLGNLHLKFVVLGSSLLTERPTLSSLPLKRRILTAITDPRKRTSVSRQAVCLLATGVCPSISLSVPLDSPLLSTYLSEQSIGHINLSEIPRDYALLSTSG